MSFEVRAISPFDDNWVDRDNDLANAAGRESDFAGAGINGKRDNGWLVGTFAEARNLKSALETIPEVNVTIREK